jgi:hypothetical protein
MRTGLKLHCQGCERIVKVGVPKGIRAYSGIRSCIQGNDQVGNDPLIKSGSEEIVNLTQTVTCDACRFFLLDVTR